MNKEIIRLSNISKKFSTNNKDLIILKNINLKIKKGDLVSLGSGSKHYSISPSGCVIVVTHRGCVLNIDKEDL